MRLEIYLRLWLFIRRRALKRLAAEYPSEYEDARRHFRSLPINHEPMWGTQRLGDDLALTDAADSLLGRQP